MIHAAKVMASPARALIEDPKNLKEAKKIFNSQVSKYPYVCSIPRDILPLVIKIIFKFLFFKIGICFIIKYKADYYLRS